MAKDSDLPSVDDERLEGLTRPPSIHEATFLRHDFYRDAFRSVMVVLERVLAGLIVMLVLLIAAYTVGSRHVVHYVDLQGYPIADPALDRPNVSNEEILDWATKAAERAYTFNFENRISAFESILEDFTPDGRNEYKKLIIGSNNYQALIDPQRHTRIVSKAIGAPVLVSAGVDFTRRWAWVVEIPMQINYSERVPATNSIKESSETLTVSVTIVREHLTDSVKGYGIAHINYNRPEQAAHQ